MKKILLKGPILSQSGYGEQTRFAFRSLMQSGKYDVYIHAINWGNTSWLWRDDTERRLIDELIKKTVAYNHTKQPYDISIQVTIPDEFERIAKYNIGYTAGIETDRVSLKWLDKANLMDRIIVVSSHSKRVFENTAVQFKVSDNSPIQETSLVTPIDVVNFPYEDKPKETTQLLDDFSDSVKNKFNFLLVAQQSPRKNILHTLNWFLEEFEDDPDVGIVLKMNCGNNSTLDLNRTEELLNSLLRTKPDKKCKVYLLHGQLSDYEMQKLYRHPKINCLLSLTHGEGFGLPIFEAACNDLPIVTTGWSGQCDFLYHMEGNKIKEYFTPVDFKIAPIQPEAVWGDILVKESQWCYPDPKSSKRAMRKVYKKYKQAERNSKKLSKILREKHSFVNQSSMFVEAVDSLYTTEGKSNVVVL